MTNRDVRPRHQHPTAGEPGLEPGLTGLESVVLAAELLSRNRRQQKSRLFGGSLTADGTRIENYPPPPAQAEPRADASVIGNSRHRSTIAIRCQLCNDMTILALAKRSLRDGASYPNPRCVSNRVYRTATDRYQERRASRSQRRGMQNVEEDRTFGIQPADFALT